MSATIDSINALKSDVQGMLDGRDIERMSPEEAWMACVDTHGSLATAMSLAIKAGKTGCIDVLHGALDLAALFRQAITRIESSGSFKAMNHRLHGEACDSIDDAHDEFMWSEGGGL